MPTTYSYLVWLTIFVWMPIAMLFWLNFGYLVKYKRTLLHCVRNALIISFPWDFWAIRTDVWRYPSDRIIGVWFLGLPLEEYCFIIFVTIEIALITLVLKKYLEKSA